MKIRLRSRILSEIASEVGFGRKPFRYEEGGYLAGRFDGHSIEIVNYWRDQMAERTAGSIRLREAHLDYVTDQIEQSGDPSLYLVGTWHIHPPGYGSQCSHVDAEYLFLDHTLIHAGGLANARLPQAHLVLSWNDLHDYQIYGLQAQIPGLVRLPSETQADHLQAIEAALQQKCYAGVLLRGDGVHAEPYIGPTIQDAFIAGRLEGFFWLFPHESITEEVEQIYLANFLHHVRKGSQRLDLAKLQTNPSTHRIVAPKRNARLTYYRLTLVNNWLTVSAQKLQYMLYEKPPRAIHIPCQVAEEITVLVSNPDAPEQESFNLGAQPDTLIGDIGRAICARYGLESVPLLSAQRPSREQKKWRERTVMDGFGEVLLPDDVQMRELLDTQSRGLVQLFWRSPDLHPEIVYELRTQRLHGLGYDRNRLLRSTVLVAGLGLLGSEITTLLAASGIGKLLMIDQGTVDFTNIYRQRLYTRKDVYQPKVDVAAQLLSGVGIQLEAHRISIPTVSSNLDHSQEILATLDQLVAQSNLVIGTLDSFSGRAVLQALCLKHKVPFLAVALDLLDPIGVAQASLFLSLPDRPGCYACGRRLVPAYDSGVCTIAPLEFPPITGGLAFRLSMDVLHQRVTMPRSIQLYSNLNIEEQEMMASDVLCELCGHNGLVKEDNTDLYRRILDWLTGA